MFGAEPDERYPVCVAGERACPPEDVGGAFGYAEFLAALADPAHPRHEPMRSLVGGAFDPARVRARPGDHAPAAARLTSLPRAVVGWRTWLRRT